MKRLLIDTDTAGDDVTSLLFGLRWPDVTLEAITVAAGNVHLPLAVKNALITTEVAERADVPVFAGADRPLMRPLTTAYYVHGEDGMGDSHFPDPEVSARPGFAPDVIVELATRHEGELEIVAQAPLTNVALALMKDADLPRKVAKLWIMGGANNSLGNITPAAEFNFYVDPEAAHLVLDAGFEVTLVPWDACAGGELVGDELDPIVDMHTKLSEFYLAVNAAVWKYMRAQGTDGISHPDALTIAMALDHDVVVASERLFVDVEYRGTLTSGYSLVDRDGVLDEPPNCEVVLRADKERFKVMLYSLLAG